MAKKTSDKLADEASKHETAENLIALIQRELEHGQYIYRGVPKEYRWEGQTDISSIIFRTYREQNGEPSKLFDGDIRPVRIEHDIILQAERHFLDSMTNREILTSIRHFGGLTTLIDFSRDLMVALFFACYGDLDRDGLLIAYKVHGGIESSKHRYFSETPDKKNALPTKIEFVEPAITTPTSSARVIAQKSIFVHAPDGFIPPEACTIFSIPSNLKATILTHLKRFHHIDQETIYNDMHGLIDLTNRSATAYVHTLAGTALLDQGKYNDAKIEFTKAINQKPNFAGAYCLRAEVYIKLKLFGDAIEDLNEAIRLEPDFVVVYAMRGTIHKVLGNKTEAQADFAKARKLGFKMPDEMDDSFHYESFWDNFKSQKDPQSK